MSREGDEVYSLVRCSPRYEYNSSLVGCQYSDATTCSGRGTAQDGGSCVCVEGQTGQKCDDCSAHGALLEEGDCTCAAGWLGAAWVEHPASKCEPESRKLQSSLLTLSSCRSGCAVDAECNFFRWYTGVQCEFSSSCSPYASSWGSASTVYVSMAGHRRCRTATPSPFPQVRKGFGLSVL